MSVCVCECVCVCVCVCVCACVGVCVDHLANFKEGEDFPPLAAAKGTQQRALGRLRVEIARSSRPRRAPGHLWREGQVGAQRVGGKKRLAWQERGGCVVRLAGVCRSVCVCLVGVWQAFRRVCKWITSSSAGVDTAGVHGGLALGGIARGEAGSSADVAAEAG